MRHGGKEAMIKLIEGRGMASRVRSCRYYVEAFFNNEAGPLLL